MVSDITRMKQIAKEINKLIEEALALVPDIDSWHRRIDKPIITIRERARQGWYAEIKDALMTEHIGFRCDMDETIEEMKEVKRVRK